MFGSFSAAINDWLSASGTKFSLFYLDKGLTALIGIAALFVILNRKAVSPSTKVCVCGFAFFCGVTHWILSNYSLFHGSRELYLPVFISIWVVAGITQMALHRVFRVRPQKLYALFFLYYLASIAIYFIQHYFRIEMNSRAFSPFFSLGTVLLNLLIAGVMVREIWLEYSGKTDEQS